MSVRGPLALDEVDRIAALANLALTEEERALFARQLADVLTYAEEILQVDTAGVAPTAHVLDEGSQLREDAAVPCLPRDRALANAPDPAPGAGFFKVPRVIGG